MSDALNKNIAFPKLETDRLWLRRLTDADNPFILSLRSSPVVNRYLDRTPQHTREEIVEYIHKTVKGVDDKLWFYWVLEHKVERMAVGTICLFNFSEDQLTAEVGYEMHPDHHRKGYMQEALSALLNFAQNDLNLKYLTANCHQDNAASRGMLKRNSFKAMDQRSGSSDHPLMVYRRVL